MVQLSFRILVSINGLLGRVLSTALSNTRNDLGGNDSYECKIVLLVKLGVDYFLSCQLLIGVRQRADKTGTALRRPTWPVACGRRVKSSAVSAVGASKRRFEPRQREARMIGVR